MINVYIKKACYHSSTSILKNFHMHIDKGEIVTIIGESGIGKSTLLKIIAGLHKNYEGEVIMPSNPKIAFIPQNKCLLPWKTVEQNIALLKYLEDQQIDRIKLSELTSSLGLSAFTNQFPLKLSGGQYQRVTIGQAFFYEPEIILMDEPFSALDQDTKIEIQDVFLKLQQKHNITALFVTHNIAEAEYMRSRIIKLEDL